jgi:hypothetical protein
MWRSLVIGGIALALCAAPLRSADEGGWLWEAGLLGGNHDNFFFRGNGGSQPSSDLLSVYLAGEVERDTGPAELTVAVGGTAVQVADIADADYQGLEAAVAYKRGRGKLQGSYGMTLNRLYAEEGEAVFFDEQSVDLWYRYSLSARLWLRAGVEFEQWDFDPAENDRDADVVKLDLTARWALSDRAGLRLSLLSEDRDANGARNNRTGEGWAVALEARPTDDVDLFLRFRRRDREYDDALPGDRNFGRDDTTDDINFNLRWRVSERWGAQLRDTYRSGDSTRPDRNFTGNQVEVGAFVRF